MILCVGSIEWVASRVRFGGSSGTQRAAGKRGRFHPYLYLIAVMSHKVSVIVPTYNRAALVTRAAYSVLRQTYRNIELEAVRDW